MWKNCNHDLTLRPKKAAIEVRLPRHLLDILACTCASLGVGAGEEAGAVLFRYYIEVLGSNTRRAVRLKLLLEDNLAKGPAAGRYSLKVSEPIYKIFDTLSSLTHLNKTDLLNCNLLQMKAEILEEQKKNRVDEVRRIVLAAS